MSGAPGKGTNPPGIGLASDPAACAGDGAMKKMAERRTRTEPNRAERLLRIEPPQCAGGPEPGQACPSPRWPSRGELPGPKPQDDSTYVSPSPEGGRSIERTRTNR